ncbi:4'-phosphopantetheinyl transferase superfamily protein [Streptomyces sp. NPDC057245]|uniref:4'-phosphopantetheinyl transferase superfamily protein n=1 Tax=Streptomyces TaxID=1883 RepID=UPI001C1E387E|nr:4'-phosphopantetheinyl transferase superfamily protein [Streptomyces sp. A108]MBU6533017.1 4-phosphopantetheinyl transferase family protein [Streptomyces sp. A108]
MIRIRLAAGRSPLPVADLTPGEARQEAALPGERRRRHWRTARRALRTVLAGTGLHPDTSRHAFPHRLLSLSYAGPLAVAAAVVGGDAAAVAGTGVDIELGDPPPPQTARFFLGEHEHRHLLAAGAAERPKALLRYWTVKEALFKADPANAGTDLRRYLVDRPGQWRGAARLAGDARPRFRYASFDVPPGFLSVACMLSPNGVAENARE